jgi:hypothetical protein
MAVAVKDIAGATRIPVAGGVGGYHLSIKDVTFDNSYATGGEPLTAGDLGLASIVFAAAMSAGGYVFSYDVLNSKLLAYRGDNANGSVGPMIEVANAVDLSAVTTRVMALGVPA